MKTALVYDRVNKWGGAERVLLAFRKIFPDATLYTSVYDSQRASWAKVFDIKTSFLQSLPFATNHELFATFMPLAFESFDFSEFDLVISVTSEAAKGIITKPSTKHICYCLTPTRYLWSGYEEYFKNTLLKFISKTAVSYLKAWDKIVAHRPDKFIAISKEVQSRISKYYDRVSVVVYPPLSISNFIHSASSGQISNQFQNSKSKNDNYFLIVSRLVPYKRIDLAVRAFNKLELPLKIIGVGSEMEGLKRMAKSNVEFLGNLTDKELVRYYSECRALVFPGNEDFGLTIVEAQSFGKPVIAFKAGGALETIIEGKTGLFFDKQNIESLVSAIKQFENVKFSPENCIENAQKYSFEEFKKQILKQVQDDTKKDEI